MNTYPIYPEVRVDLKPIVEIKKQDGSHDYFINPKIECSTKLRGKFHGNDKLCFVKFNATFTSDKKELSNEQISAALNRFHSEVYIMQLCGKYSDMESIYFNEPMFVVDENQESEVERLTKLLMP